MQYSFKVFHKISDIGKPQWDQLAPSHYPFLQYAFLAALEESQCCDKKTGWQPYHLALFDSELPSALMIAVMPMYLKENSYGEYVFDWAWADAYQRNDIAYYPKLLNAIPFSPCNGPRLVSQHCHSDLLVHFIEQIKSICQLRGISSWHSLFHPEKENQSRQQLGLLGRVGCQFHWYNHDYLSFDHYLESFNSRKRKGIKRERRKVTEQLVTIETLEGESISTDQLKAFYHCYHLTYLKRGRQGYLNFDFFQRILATMPQHLVMFCASHQGDIVACALCFKNTDPELSILYGRYWGCLDEYDSLHFETCYYHGLEYCIKHKIGQFDPGAQGEHKIQRGFEPTLTYSSHYIAHPQFSDAIEDFLQRETPAIIEYQTQARELLPFKNHTDH